MTETEGVLIPYTSLSKDVLTAIIEEFVTREGTDYGDEFSLEEKVEQVLVQLKKGSVVITFDEESESCSIQAA